MSLERRTSARATKGIPPARLGFSDPDGSQATFLRARTEREKAESDLRTAREIAELKEQLLRSKLEVREKTLALERAKVSEESARESARVSPEPERRGTPLTRRQEIEQLIAGRPRSAVLMRGWASDIDGTSVAVQRDSRRSTRRVESDTAGLVRRVTVERAFATTDAQPPSAVTSAVVVPSGADQSSSPCSSESESESESQSRRTRRRVTTPASSRGTAAFRAGASCANGPVVQFSGTRPGMQSSRAHLHSVAQQVQQPVATPPSTRKLLTLKKKKIKKECVPEPEEAQSQLNPQAALFYPGTYGAPMSPWAGTWMPPYNVTSHLKPLELPRFSGQGKDYLKWRQRFRQLIDDCPFMTNSHKLAHLRDALAGGSAEDLIADVLDGPGAYTAIMAELESWYGGKYRELNNQERELMDWPTILNERDISPLKNFAVRLRNLLLNMDAVEVEPGRELYLVLTRKIPRRLLSRYFDRHDDTECDVRAFSAFLISHVQKQLRVEERTGTERSAARDLRTKSAPPPPRNHGTSVHSFNTNTREAKASSSFQPRLKCVNCAGAHHLSSCNKFKGLSVADRWDFVRKNKSICGNCLAEGHWSTRCSAARCSTCQGSHHVLLHRDQTQRTSQQREPLQNATPLQSAAASSAVTNAANTVQHEDDCLMSADGETASAPLSFMTVPVILSNGSRRFQGTALLDPASSTSYVRQQVASEIGLDGPRKQLTASVLGGKQVSGNYEHVTLTASDADGTINAEFRAWVLPSVCPSVQPVDWSSAKESWEHLQDIPFPVVETPRIDILIGINAIQLHPVLEEVAPAAGDLPIARLTPLGWTCLSPGPTSSTSSSYSTVDGLESENLDALVRNYLGMEAAGTKPPCYDAMLSAEDTQVEERTKATAQFVDGRVKLGIPWVDAEPNISSNRPQAMQRLRSLERSLSSRPSIKQQYHDVMQSHLDKGYIREVPDEEVARDGEQQWFLPHFPVVRNDKETTKVRIVFDAAAKWDGRSINDEMHSGPALQADIVQVLIRFCAEPVAIVADISEMFLQVGLLEEDRKYHRFIWRFDDGVPRVYEFQRVVFGIKASPYLAGKAVQLVVREFGTDYPPAITTILERSLYVDDLLPSCPTVEDAIQSRIHLQNILARGGFHLRKWLSSNREVLESIPTADRAASTVLHVGEQTHCTLPTTKTLGVTWCAEKDVFSFQFKRPEFLKLTRRSVLSGLASAFDPRGQIAPFIIRARVMLQDTWLLDQSWDEELPAMHAKKWQEWFDELPDLSAIAAPRSFQTTAKSDITVHTFTDASDRAIAAVTYVRAVDRTGDVRVTLALAKAKTAPARRQSIPQLELRGAVLGLRTSSEVAKALNIPIADHMFWTDSMNVLGWIRSHSRRFKVDIGNRISELQKATKPSQWRHVPGKQNPADKATRGLRATELAADQVWWHGPKFLVQPASSWPPDKTATTESLPGVVKRENTFAQTVTQPDPPMFHLQPDRYRTWEQLTRVTAWCFRFVYGCRRKAYVGMKGEENSKDRPTLPVRTESRTVNVPELMVGEINLAEKHWIRHAQKEVYGSTMESLLAGKQRPASDPLAALNPTLLTEQGALPLMVVGGRLNSEHLPYHTRLPIILPQKHTVTRLLIEQQDRLCRHAVGAHHLLSKLREKYWVVKGLSAVKVVRQSCVRCQKNWGTPAAQIMGPLPDARVAGSLRPFSRCGIDFAGPFLTKQGRGRVQTKRYLCLMTCLETRACHLELAYSMDTGSFLMAFNRFVKRRGTPDIVVTDNGSNFVAAERELREAVEQLDNTEIARSLADRHIEWRFNPPRAPHFGGAFEIMVKAAKRALRSTLATANLTDEELHTAIIAAEDLINSRPLTTVSADATDLEPLTPQQFIVGRCDPPLPLEWKCDSEEVHPRDRFAVVQRAVKDTWRRWLAEFVPLLNLRKKWRKTQKNVAVDEVVLCIEPDTPRGNWPLGRIRRIFPGPDGCVRVVDVLIRGKVYRRAIQRLIPLPVE